MFSGQYVCWTLTLAEAASLAEHAVAGGGQLTAPLLTLLLGHVARSRKEQSRARYK